MAEPVITFGAAEGFGALTGWEAQSNDSNVNSQRANTLDKSGNESASKLYDEKTDVQSSYKADVEADPAAPTIPAEVGALVNSLILTSIDITTRGDAFAEMSLSGHNHTANAHTSSPALNKGAHSLTLDSGFGAQDFLGGTAGDNASCVSGRVAITCQHNDQIDGSGDHLVGENYDGKIEATSEWVGVPSAAVGAGWDTTSVVTRTENTGFLRTTATGIKALALA